MKLVIVVDSSTGLTKQEAEARGWHYLPLIVNVDGSEYEDGIGINSRNFFDICKVESKVSTSCSSIGQVQQLLEEIAKPDTFVVIYPISKHLSAQYQNCVKGVEGFENVHVIASENIFIPIIQELVELEKGVENKDFTIKEGIDIIEKKISRDLNNLVVIPKYFDSLVRGGRLSPSAAKLAKLLKIVPIITLKDGKLEKLGKGRIFDKTAVKTVVDTYKKLNKKNENYVMIFAHSMNPDRKQIMSEITAQVNNKMPFIEVLIPPSIAIHTGLEALAVIFIKPKYLISEYNLKGKQ
ncbi:MAG: DegV family protein [Metamycoplasmataceae bacterium]